MVYGDSWSGLEFFSNVLPTKITAWIAPSAAPDRFFNNFLCGNKITFNYRRDWRKSGLSEYTCPPFGDVDIDEEFDKLWQLQNTTFVDISEQIVQLAPVDDFYLFNYNLTIADPAEGYVTYFFELTFENEDGGMIHVTTQSVVAPDTFSYDDCSTPAECLGCFI